MRSRAAARFWSCPRCSLAVTVRTPPARRPCSRQSILLRSHSGTDRDRARSKDSSTRLSAVFTPCPPGPEDREKRSLKSAADTTNVRVTIKSSATPTTLGRPPTAGLASQGTNTTEPTVLRPCRSVCALAASASGYRSLTVTLMVSVAIASSSSPARQENSSAVLV
jgi:hypothetical protein